MLAVIATAGWIAALVLATVVWRQHRAELDRTAARALPSQAIGGGLDDQLTAFGAEAEAQTTSRPGARLALAAAAAAPVAMLVAALLVSGDPSTVSTSPLAVPDGLELLDMRPAHAGSDLVVTGRVRVRGNRTAAITAFVTAFDSGGHVVGRGHALVDDARLDVEGESTFQVAVPASADVERYQVRFETPIGPLAHFDRRWAANGRTP